MAEGDTPDMTATTQSAEEAALALNSLQQSADGAADSIQGLNVASSAAQGVFTSLNQVMSGYNMSLKNIGSLTEQQTAQMSLLTAGVIGARKAFEGLNGVDTGNLRVFKDQFAELSETVSRSPFLNAAGQAQVLVEALSKMGAPAAEVKKAADGGVKSLISYGSAFFESADNALRFQNALIQLAGKTGGLGDLYRKAGEDLSGINSIMSQQNAIISETVKATGLNEKQVESYYAVLGLVPKAMESYISTTGASEDITNMLTATIKLAAGDGRKYEEVIGDLHTAFKEYGMVGEDALRFTQRFSDISNKFGVELEDVRSHLMGAANAFKIFSDAGGAASRMSESLSGIMNDYIGNLQQSGMSGERAARVVKDMTDSIASLNVAQKAFLSSQTGGAGGLMGAFQIEKMMREGKIDEVFDKVRNTMQKQFGKIVTLDEAASSPAAASQLQKQMLILQKGPLGGMVKTDQDAYRLLETLRAKQDGRSAADMGAAGLATDTVQKAIDRGTSFEEKSYTQLTAINSNIAAIRRAADIPNLGLVQKSGTASSGAPTFLGGDTAAQMEMRQGLQGSMASSAQRGGELAKTYQGQFGGAGTAVEDMSGVSAASAINDFQNWFKQIPASLKAPLDTLKQAVLSGDRATVESQMASLEKDIKDKREAASKMKKEDRQRALAAAQAEEDAVKGMRNWYEQYGTGASGSSGIMLGTAAKMQPQTKKTGSASSSTSGGAANTIPEVYVTEEGASGRIKLQVSVKVVEDGGQGKSITPTY